MYIYLNICFVRFSFTPLLSSLRYIFNPHLSSGLTMRSTAHDMFRPRLRHDGVFICFIWIAMSCHRNIPTRCKLRRGRFNRKCIFSSFFWTMFLCVMCPGSAIAPESTNTIFGQFALKNFSPARYSFTNQVGYLPICHALTDILYIGFFIKRRAFILCIRVQTLSNCQIALSIFVSAAIKRMYLSRKSTRVGFLL